MELLEKVNLLLALDYRAASTLLAKLLPNILSPGKLELLWCYDMHPAWLAQLAER